MKLQLPPQQLGKMIGTLAIISLSLTGVIWLQKYRLNPNQAKLTTAEYKKQEQLEKVQLDVYKGVPNIGFNNLLADWFYLRFIQYFGDGEARGETGYSLSPDYLELVVDRDPRFVDATLKISVSTSIFAGQPDKTVAYLEKSLKETPSKVISPVYPPYYLWIYKGIDELLFLGDVEAAKNSNTMAANWAETYPDEGSQNTAKRRRETVKFLEKNPQSKVAQIGAWTQVLSGSVDAKTQERAITEIKALGGEIIVTPEGRVSIRVPEGID
ncbi:hypothetical protein [Crocosphaera sp. XPORK-15E]|uniref:hypothetical protein n=1 Tax=Crocosphaera sp. XPORK-15E TaxID=3110247 RepID=UPI002B2120F5|nr:hypothetical protein [Crocosphaera sp. XPORK-15E]MEA5534365.1 hypothetical protein [Crocosphaera sp. XPORK-15E]